MHAAPAIKNIIMVCLTIAISFCAGCRQRTDTEQAGAVKTIVMGGVYPLSGPLSVFGQAAREGLVAGAEYANREMLDGSGYQIMVIAEDSQGEPAAGVVAYRRLVDGRGAKIINVILSNVAVALKPLADQDGVLLFADSTHSALIGGLTLRHSQTAEQEAEFILGYAREKLGAETMLAIVADDDYGESFIRALGRDVSSLRYDAAAPDLRPIATEAAARKTDVVIVVGVGGPLGEIIRQLREQGFTGTIMATVAFDVAPSTRQIAGDAAQGVWYPRLVQDMERLSRETDGAVTPAVIAGASTIKVIAFNDVVFVAKALAEGKLRPSDIRDFLLSQDTIDGVGTTVQPRDDGTLLPQLVMDQVP